MVVRSSRTVAREDAYGPAVPGIPPRSGCKALVSPSSSATVTVSAEWPLRRSGDGTFAAKWMQTPARLFVPLSRLGHDTNTTSQLFPIPSDFPARPIYSRSTEGSLSCSPLTSGNSGQYRLSMA